MEMLKKNHFLLPMIQLGILLHTCQLHTNKKSSMLVLTILLRWVGKKGARDAARIPSFDSMKMLKSSLWVTTAS